MPWTPAEILTTPAPPPDATIRYGPGPDNIADVRLPSGGGPRGASAGSGQPLVVVLHGGFWRAAFDRKHVGPMAAALAAEGYLVCVPEFRRVGQAGGGWPGTFDDVAAAVDRLPLLVAAIAPGACDPGRLLLLGHSAGAHLALWAAGRHLLPRDVPWRADAGSRPRIAGVAALAPVSDLVACYRQRLGGGAAADLLGGGPEQHPQRLRPRTARTGQRRDAPREPWSFSAAPAGRSIGGVARPRRPHATRCGDRERSRSGVMHHYLGALSRDSARPSSHVVADRPDADLDICPSSGGQGPHLEAAYLLTSAPVLSYYSSTHPVGK
jgi:acetyl esterase/lipase